MNSENKKLSFGQFMIDLTPLLDVVLILLVVVLAKNIDSSNKIGDANKTYEDATKIVSDMEIRMNDEVTYATDMYNAASEHISSSENMYEYVNLVTIYASYTPSNRKERTIYVFVNSQQESWLLTPSTQSAVWEEVKEYLENTLNDYSNAPTFFSIKYDVDMLYRDEEEINRIRGELESEFSSLYDIPYTEIEDE